jgi:hypothetical protein
MEKFWNVQPAIGFNEIFSICIDAGVDRKYGTISLKPIARCKFQNLSIQQRKDAFI